MLIVKGCSEEGCESIATPQSAIIIRRGDEIRLACTHHLRADDVILQVVDGKEG